VRLPNLPQFVPAPKADAPTLHWRYPYTEPTECGLQLGPSTINPNAVTCRRCLTQLGIEVDDRTDKQKANDLAGYLWRSTT
jgi:hypothetical protein